MNIKKFQKEVNKVWISNRNDFSRILLGLGGEVGEVQDLVKKYLRNDYTSNEEIIKYTDKLKLEIGDVFFYLVKLCDYYDFDTEEIMSLCINKLNSRKKRNKIKGSGSNR